MIDAKSYLHREDSIREIERTLNPKSPIIHRVNEYQLKSVTYILFSQ